MNTQGKPIIGALLGALAALIVILILMFGAIVPPTQFVVWGLLGLGVIAGSLLLTTAFRSARFVTVLVVSVAMLVWSAVGLPSHNANGDLTGGCTLAGTSTGADGSPLDAATPGSTSVSDPFVIDPGGEIEWSGSTPGAFEGWKGSIAVDFGGFPIPVWSNGHENSGLDPDEGGTIDVGGQVDDFEGSTGIALAGVFHLVGNIHSADGACDMDAYLELPSDGLFSGLVLIVLWVLLAVVLVVLVVLMLPVCRVRKAARNAPSGATDAVAAAGAGVPGAGETPSAASPSVASPAPKKPAPKKLAPKKPAPKKPDANG